MVELLSGRKLVVWCVRVCDVMALILIHRCFSNPPESCFPLAQRHPIMDLSVSIRETQAKIDEVAADIKAAEEAARAAGAANNQEDVKLWRSEKAALRIKEAALMSEKAALMNKEAALMEERLILLRRGCSLSSSFLCAFGCMLTVDNIRYLCPVIVRAGEGKVEVKGERGSRRLILLFSLSTSSWLVVQPLIVLGASS